MTDVLYVHPAEDAATAELARCGRALRRRTHRPTAVLAGSAVTRASVEGALGPGIRALLWFGHGERDCLTREGKPIVDASILAAVGGGIVVSIACFSARSLGPAAVHGGVAAYLGFDDPLGLPMGDPDPTCDAIIAGLTCLVWDGHAIGCAADRLREALYEVRETHLAAAEAAQDPGSELWTTWAWVKSNHLSVVVCGDDAASI